MNAPQPSWPFPGEQEAPGIFVLRAGRCPRPPFIHESFVPEDVKIHSGPRGDTSHSAVIHRLKTSG